MFVHQEERQRPSTERRIALASRACRREEAGHSLLMGRKQRHPAVL
jgi:hypothetical protein